MIPLRTYLIIPPLKLWPPLSEAYTGSRKDGMKKAFCSGTDALPPLQ
jgi:hypothetical protein